MDIKVVKFGGTSVGSPERMKNIPEIINPLEKQIIVLSAVSGTTNSLSQIATAFQNSQFQEGKDLIVTLWEKYKVFISELLHKPEYQKEADDLLNLHFELLLSLASENFSLKEEKLILAQGELLSTQIFHIYLKEEGIPSVFLPALEFMRLDADQEPRVDYLSEKLIPLLDAEPGNLLFITQGYICRNKMGEVDNLKRGGSDYTASLIGAALRATEIQIWTDIDGMHNNDPRIVSNTKPISYLSFEEAAELAYFGAKILHPQSVLPAQKYHVPVRILNTLEPKALGTLISEKAQKGDIKSIAAKDGILALRIHSTRMLLAYGFLRKVFEVFERYRTPIDMITTSEVSISLTIDDPTYLPEIIEEVKTFGHVDVDHNQTIICIVGDFKAGRPGMADKVISCIKHIPLRMISYGGSAHNMSILIDSDKKAEVLIALQKGVYHD
jgi:aspartate kinase